MKAEMILKFATNNCFENLKMSHPVNHRPVYQLLNRVSEWNETESLSNFIVHLQIWTGTIDDLNDVKFELAKLHNKPVSIIIVIIKPYDFEIKDDYKEIYEYVYNLQLQTRKFIAFYEIDDISDK